jgi:hypothetical protein
VITVTVLCSILALLLVYIGGAVSCYDQPPLWAAEPFTPEVLDPWYPRSLADAYPARTAERQRLARLPMPVMGQNPRVLAGAR